MWTEDRIDTLKKLWGEGLSAGVIAGRLGLVTRNAVIGKAHRLGLLGRASTVGTNGRNYKNSKIGRRKAKQRAEKKRQLPFLGEARSAAAIAYREPSLPPAPPPQSDMGEDLSATVKTLDDLQDHQCRWIPGEPGTGYCGRDINLGHPSYCPHHHARSAQPVQPRPIRASFMPGPRHAPASLPPGRYVSA